jgi:hypothetical protein
MIFTVFCVVVIGGFAYLVWQGSQEPPEKIDLKLQLKAGESHEMKLTYFQDVTQTFKDRQNKANLQAEMIVGLDVLSVDANGTMGVELFYKAIKLKADGLKEQIDFDSANPKPAGPNDLLQRAFAIVYSAVIDNNFKVEVNPAGKVSGTLDFDEVRAKIEEGISKERKNRVADINNFGSKNKDVGKKLEEMMMEIIRLQRLAGLCGSILSSAIMDTQEMMDCVIVKFPDKPLSAGSKWRDKSHLNLGFLADANTTYKFKRRENGCAYIDAVSDIDMGKNLRIIEINSLDKISRRMSGARKSSNVVDEATGLLRKSEAVMIFSGVEKIEPDKLILPVRPDMTIPITIEGSMVIELIK